MRLQQAVDDLALDLLLPRRVHRLVGMVQRHRAAHGTAHIVHCRQLREAERALTELDNHVLARHVGGLAVDACLRHLEVVLSLLLLCHVGGASGTSGWLCSVACICRVGAGASIGIRIRVGVTVSVASRIPAIGLARIRVPIRVARAEEVELLVAATVVVVAGVGGVGARVECVGLLVAVVVVVGIVGPEGGNEGKDECKCKCKYLLSCK